MPSPLPGAASETDLSIDSDGVLATGMRAVETFELTGAVSPCGVPVAWALLVMRALYLATALSTSAWLTL